MLSRNLSKLHTYLFSGWGSDPVRVILIGLDAAGKTTFLYKVHSGEIITTIPTIGFSVETLRVQKAEITCWDVGGCDKIRPLWRHYTDSSAAVVMFIDSNDRDRMYDAKQELDLFLRDVTMVGVPLLVVANKQDLPRAASVEEVINYLSLRDIVGHEWSIIPTSVASGVGVSEILTWIKRAAKEGRDMKSENPSTQDASTTAPSAEASAPATSGHLIHVKPAEPSVPQPAASMLDATSASPPPPLPPNSEDVRKDWMVRADIPEEEFLALLDTFQLDIWDHYTHVRIAWVLLNKHGIEEGFKRIEEALRRFIERSARTDHRSFHATMTRFWCHMIAYAMQWLKVNSTASTSSDEDASDLSGFKPFIVDVCTKGSALGVATPLWDKMLFKKYYSTSAMFRNEARAAPSPPDLLSLPDIAQLLRAAESGGACDEDLNFVENTVYWVKV